MSAQSHDDINKIFQSKLTDTDSGDGYWNIPPDRVFDDAMIEVAAIGKARRNRRRRIGVLILLLIGLMSAGWLLNNHIDRLNARIIQLETQLAEQEIEISNPNDNRVIEENNLIENNTGGSIHLTETNSIPKENVNSTTNIIQRQQAPALTKIYTEKDLLNVHELMDVQDNAQALTSQIANVSNQDIITIGEIGARSQSILYSSLIPEIGLAFSSYPEIMKEDHSGNITLALIPTTYVSWARMDNILPGSYALTKYGDLRSSYGVQLAGNFPIKNSLSITGGLAFSSIRNRSELSDQIEYDVNNQYSNNSGQQMYTSNIEIMTPLGMHENATSFDVSNFSLQDGSVIENRTQLDQSIRIISLQTGLRNSFRISDRLSAFAGVGLSYSIIENYCSDMHMQLYDGADMIDEFDIHTEDGSALNNNFFSLNGELGVNFSIGTNWGINLTGSYNRGLTDLTRGSSQTYFNSVGIGTGFYLKI